MDPILFDPNNHVPEVTPGDVWDDAEGLDPRSGAAPVMLPRKKARSVPAPSAATDDPAEGLRIESKARQRPLEDEVYQLEVQQIDGNVLRLDPEVSTVAKMPRQIVYQEAPGGNSLARPARDVTKEWGLAGVQSMRWILGTGLGIATVVIVAMMLLPLINQSNAARPRPGDGGLMVVAEEKIEGLEPMQDLLGRQAEAVRIFNAVMSTPNVDEILPWVRDAAAVAPLVRAHHQRATVDKDWLAPAATTWNVADNDGRAFGMLEGSLPDFALFRAYWVISENQLRLDWKATTGYGTATFAELSRQQGDPAEIRGQIIPSDYFTAVYPEAEFQSYQLLAPDNRRAVWCYVRRGDPLAGALEELCGGADILSGTPTQQKVTVRLDHGPAGSLPNQWLISGMLHKEWLTP